MGKRGSVEKPSSNITFADKSTAETSNDNLTDDLEGPYVLTGNFAHDFRQLAKRAGFPELRIVAKPRRPSLKNLHSPGAESAPPQTARSDRKDDKKDDSKTDPRTTSQLTNQSEQEKAPTTFVVKEKCEYFKPTVQVQWEDEGVKSLVKELYIRGWRIDDRIVDIFKLTLPTQERLAKIDFSNTGLTDSLLDVFASVVNQLPFLRSLSLDGNPVYLQRYGMFLGEESTLQNLSLRNCHLNDMGAYQIAKALTANKSLITLNLCFNKISCDGAAAFAKALRTNRTLLSLDLGSNLISDTGVAKLAETISKFSLNHEETVQRRLLLSRKSVEESSTTTTTTKSSHHGKGDRPASVRSGSIFLGKDLKKEKQQKGKKMENKKPQTEDKVAKKASSTDTSKEAKKGKKASMSKVEKKVGGIIDQDTSDAMEIPNPLLEPTEEVDGELYIAGNRALINLNLTGNKIGEAGMKSLLYAVQYQCELAVAHPRNIAVGLMRLSLKRNNVSDDNMAYQNLQELMVSRDPYFKPDNASHDDAGSIKVILKIFQSHYNLSLLHSENCVGDFSATVCDKRWSDYIWSAHSFSARDLKQRIIYFNELVNKLEKAES